MVFLINTNREFSYYFHRKNHIQSVLFYTAKDSLLNCVEVVLKSYKKKKKKKKWWKNLNINWGRLFLGEYIEIVRAWQKSFLAVEEKEPSKSIEGKRSKGSTGNLWLCYVCATGNHSAIHLYHTVLWGWRRNGGQRLQQKGYNWRLLIPIIHLSTQKEHKNSKQHGNNADIYITTANHSDIKH